MTETLIKELEPYFITACNRAIKDIIVACKDERLYAIGLFTNDAIHALSLIANTEEHLEATVKHYNDTVDKEYYITSTLNGMRWSYGDWGTQNIGSKHFVKVNDILFEIGKQLDDLDDDTADKYYNQLWDNVLNGFNTLNDCEFFKDYNREEVTLLLCGDLPDEFVDDCVNKLNPPTVAEKYINWDPDS